MNAVHAESAGPSMNSTSQVATGPKALVAGIATIAASGALATHARLVLLGAQTAVVRNGLRWFRHAWRHQASDQTKFETSDGTSTPTW